MKYVSILGSTGSIGTQTLEIVREQKDLCVTALAACANIELLEKQAREFNPRLVCVFEEEKARQLKQRLADTSTKVVSGMEGLLECAEEKSANIVVSAVVGMIGILPVIHAIRAGKDIAFANKETLVTAGHIIMPMAKEYKVKLLPVDSEHSAIFQCLQGMDGNKHISDAVSRLILTASGGPFRGKKREELTHIQAEDALKHPNWSMGKKITIDSATMVNKGLEVMEAKWLFDMPLDKIEVVIQPQSLIHSAVEFIDGGIMAQLGTPDMKLPIAYALFYPERRALMGERINFFDLKRIDFEKPDFDNFPGLKLAFEAARLGGSVPTVYNAANELAVAKFLRQEISYLAITDIIEDAMKNHKRIHSPDLSAILNTEQETYDFINEHYNNNYKGVYVKKGIKE